VNTTIYMNIKHLSGKSLEQALAAKLKELLSGVDWLRGWQVKPVGAADAGFDLLVTVPLPGGGKAALCVECKSEVRPSVFRMQADKHFLPSGRPRIVVPVLALPWVSPRIAELCAVHGWSWFDLAGNYRLDIPGLVRLEHTGNDPVHVTSRPTANLGTRETGRIIRMLLMPEHVGMRWTQREIQKHCKPLVSLGLVNKVARYLREQAYVEDTMDGGFRLRDPMRLLFTWRDAYRFDRNERQEYFTLLQGKKLQVALAEFGRETDGSALYAAFSAAEFQAPHVRQPKTWLYIRGKDVPLFRKQLEVKRVDTGENMVVLVPDDEGVFYTGGEYKQNDNRLPCTNLVQTYVDLYHCGGRGEEAAEAVLNQQLKPEWKRLGLKL